MGFYAAFILRLELPHFFLMGRSRSLPLPDALGARTRGSKQMLDAVMLVLGFGAFALFLGYTALCASL
jgi:hypothetical protein